MLYMKTQKEAEERKREQQIEMEYRSKALAALQQAQKNKVQNGVGDFHAYLASLRSASATHFYGHMQHEEYFPMILNLLPKLSLPEGVTFHVEKCKQQGTGDRSRLFVSMKNSCNEQSRQRSGTKTWKRNSDEHGIGLDIINDLVSGMKGWIKSERRENVYHAELMLPLGREKQPESL